MDRILRDAVIRVVNAGRTKKVAIETIVAQIPRRKLGPLSDLKFNERLLVVLKELEDENHLRLPSRKKKNNWCLTTGLPCFVNALRPEEDAAKRKEKELIAQLRHKTAWVPTLASFAYKLKKTELDIAVKINDYLRTRKPDEPRLPHRERALRIFGDEKALDGNPIRHGFFTGRITLEDLDCFYCPEPLPFHALSLDRRLTEGKPLLVIENANTYWSCCRANDARKYFAAVVYGRGNAVTALEQTCDGLHAIEVQVASKGIVYFGDLDPEGIDIPYRINVCRRKMNLPPITAAIPLYRRLLQKNFTVPRKASQNDKHDPNLARQWLGEELAERYLQKAPLTRWPQEGLTAEEIMRCLQ